MTKIYKSITRQINTIIGFNCDICKKDFNNEIEYITITTGHNDWGNDSIDSIENYELCSLKCLIKGIKEQMIYTEGDSYLQIDGELNTKQIKEIRETKLS